MASDLLIWGIIAHLIADWLLQNHWMATNKTSLTHIAAWVHGGIHFVALLFVFPAVVSVGLAVTHMIIDTRLPLNGWRRVFRQTSIKQNEHAGWQVMIWGDQVLHVATIAIAILIMQVGG